VNILSIDASSSECIFTILDKKTKEVLLTKSYLNRRDLLNIITSIILDLDQDFSLSGIVIYSGTGSFTGNRIAVSASNTFGWVKKVPVVSTSGDDWLELGLKSLDRYSDKNYFGANVIYPD
jgi:tRNA A37 threonylcarbamoyladenosine modification protein TsaB